VKHPDEILSKPKVKKRKKNEGYSNKAAGLKIWPKGSSRNLQHRAKELTHLYIPSCILPMNYRYHRGARNAKQRTNGS
jgi:hypothetical protein